MKILGIIAVVFVIGCGGWFVFQGKDITNLESLSGAGASLKKDNSVFTGNIVQGSPEELARKGGKYICTFDMKDPNTESSGTFYIEGKKFKADFKSIVKTFGKTVESHSINDGDFVYIWTNASPLAMKTPVVEGSGLGGTLDGDASFSSLGAQASWKCTSAQFDSSVFVVPAGMQFVDNLKLQ